MTNDDTIRQSIDNLDLKDNKTYFILLFLIKNIIFYTIKNYDNHEKFFNELLGLEYKKKLNIL